MRVLIACEFSGVVREAFAALGHEAWSCDLLPSEKCGNHLTMDAIEALKCSKWDLLVAHPPCTYLTNSGVRWLYVNGNFGGGIPVRDTERWTRMERAAYLFTRLLHCEVERIAVENPIPHRYALSIIGRRYSQIIQPWQFGHGETKATCLWLKGLPAMKPTNIVAGRTARVHLASPGPERWKERSRTLPGIAKAMAEQWG